MIDFTSRLFSLSPREAALKLANDFGIQYDEHQTVRPVRRFHEIRPDEIMDHRLSYCFRELTDYRNQLVMRRELHAPKSPEEEWHPLFLDSIAQLELTEYQLDVLQDIKYNFDVLERDYLPVEKDLRREGHQER